MDTSLETSQGVGGGGIKVAVANSLPQIIAGVRYTRRGLRGGEGAGASARVII